MHLIRTVAPAVLPVSLAEVKAGANLDGSEDDAKIAGLIRTAVEMIDGPDNEYQRALITQTWEMRLDCFPGFSFWPYRHATRWEATFRPPYTEIEIPLPPLQSVESITYLSGGDMVTMDPALCRCGHRRPLEGAHSPRHGLAERGLRDRGDDRYLPSGYGDSWNDVPERIRTAIIGRVQELYDGCASGVAEKLLAPYRVDWVLRINPMRLQVLAYNAPCFTLVPICRVPWVSSVRICSLTQMVKSPALIR